MWEEEDAEDENLSVNIINCIRAKFQDLYGPFI